MSDRQLSHEVINQLVGRKVEKPWGRCDIGAPFEAGEVNDQPIGEIWFERLGGKMPELLIKYLFTSQNLSIQVHPDDYIARAAGFHQGKDEAWYIISALPGAVIGLGPRCALTTDELRTASLDGSIANLLSWRTVKAGDFYYLPAGTIHAIGAGLVLVEIQQNVDVTYRFYDYGRSRPLQLKSALLAADLDPYVQTVAPSIREFGRQVLNDENAFVVERWSDGYARYLSASPESPKWIIPIHNVSEVDYTPIAPRSVWMIEKRVKVNAADGGDLLIAYRK